MTKAKTQIAYELIKQKILTGEFKESQIINEEELQKQFSISRTPIREAIKRLESERHVVIFPRKGTIVASIDLRLINNVYQIRQMAEPFAVRTACSTISKDWLKDMKQKFLELRANYSVEKYINLDTEFHKTIISVVDNIILQDAMAIVYDHDQRLRIKNSNLEQNHVASIPEHLDIIDAMLENDIDNAEKLMLQHISRSKEASIRCLVL